MSVLVDVSHTASMCIVSRCRFAACISASDGEGIPTGHVNAKQWPYCDGGVNVGKGRSHHADRLLVGG